MNDGDSTSKAIGDKKELYGDDLREDLVVNGTFLEESSDG